VLEYKFPKKIVERIKELRVKLGNAKTKNKTACQNEIKALYREEYKKAAEESENQRVKQIFEAFVDVETDHLQLSEERLN